MKFLHGHYEVYCLLRYDEKFINLSEEHTASIFMAEAPTMVSPNHIYQTTCYYTPEASRLCDKG